MVLTQLREGCASQEGVGGRTCPQEREYQKGVTLLQTGGLGVKTSQTPRVTTFTPSYPSDMI